MGEVATSSPRSVCGRCGAEAAGAYCGRCGAATPIQRGAGAGASEAALSPPVFAPSVGPPPAGSRVPVTAVAAVAPVPLEGRARRLVVVETWCVMAAFLVPSMTGAVVLLSEHFGGVDGITRFPDLVHQPVANMLLGILSYLPVAAPVPIALFLLARTGQPPQVLGLARPRVRLDLWPAVGLAVAAYLGEIAVLIPLSPLVASHSSLITSVPAGHVPAYYVIWGLVISITTSIAEEVLVNAYLLVRLGQLGWSQRSSLALSLALRTSYHVYYGLGFLLTIPFGFFVTRSFQKHHRLTRCIAAHFIFDATLVTLSILVH